MENILLIKFGWKPGVKTALIPNSLLTERALTQKERKEPGWIDMHSREKTNKRPNHITTKKPTQGADCVRRLDK